MGKFSAVPDVAVLRLMDELAVDERRAIAEALACLAEVERRKLFADLGYPDIFEYCVRHLKYSAGSAYRRLASARAAERHSQIYAGLKDGGLSLCVVALIARELEVGDPEVILAFAWGKSKREVEAWLASRRPAAPPAPDRIKVRAPVPGNLSPTPLPSTASATVICPDDLPVLSPPALPAYEYAFVAPARLHRDIERLKDILWTKRPFGSLADFLAEAVGEYLDRHDPELKLKSVSATAIPASADARRRIPRSLRSFVWARDGGRCVFLPEGGERCPCRRGLEIDHIRPFSMGGRSDDAANLRLLCREHNQLERRRLLGEGNSNYPQNSTGEKSGISREG